MSRYPLIWLTVALLLPLGSVVAQSPDDQLGVEIAAATAMLKHQYSVGPIALSPMIATPNQSPSTASVQVRPQARSEAIARAIQATIRSEADVKACQSPNQKCKLSGVSALLTLSAPSISGDSATLLAQIVQNSPSSRQPTDFETVVLTLRRRGTQWAVVAERQLGIS